MTRRYTQQEDEALIASHREGASDEEISANVSALGFYRSVSSIRHRRDRMPRDILNGIRPVRPENVPAPVVVDHGIVADDERSEADAITRDRAFCDALRLHHPEKETVIRSIPARMVPLRSHPNPVFSSSGLMVP